MQNEYKTDAGFSFAVMPKSPIGKTIIRGVMFVNVETMPIGAKIIGVSHGGEVIDFTFKPNRIEVHGDIITFLDSNRDAGFTAEVSFKRGTTLKVEVK